MLESGDFYKKKIFCDKENMRHKVEKLMEKLKPLNTFKYTIQITHRLYIQYLNLILNIERSLMSEGDEYNIS